MIIEIPKYPNISKSQTNYLSSRADSDPDSRWCQNHQGDQAASVIRTERAQVYHFLITWKLMIQMFLKNPKGCSFKQTKITTNSAKNRWKTKYR